MEMYNDDLYNEKDNGEERSVSYRETDGETRLSRQPDGEASGSCIGSDGALRERFEKSLFGDGEKRG